jgi:flavin-dependent dehydrogenase
LQRVRGAIVAIVMTPEAFDVVIVGAGPAGAATAIGLLAIKAEYANRVLLLDGSVFPRYKPCGGGLTVDGFRVLERLEVTGGPEGQAVTRIEARYCGRSLAVSCDAPIFMVFCRSEFDHWLVKEASARGVRLSLGESVLALRIQSNFVEIETQRRTIRAGLIVGADGASSRVRRQAFGSRQRPCRLLETQASPANRDALEQRSTAIFDFSPMSEGLQGYRWTFPMLPSEGGNRSNFGIFDSQVRPGTRSRSLPSLLRDWIEQETSGLPTAISSHPIWKWTPGASTSAHRVLLVGDAAGADPLVGEGISFALADGEDAALAIAQSAGNLVAAPSLYAESRGRARRARQLAVRARGAQVLYAPAGYRLMPTILLTLYGGLYGVSWGRRQPRFHAEMTRASAV